MFIYNAKKSYLKLSYSSITSNDSSFCSLHIFYFTVFAPFFVINKKKVNKNCQIINQSIKNIIHIYIRFPSIPVKSTLSFKNKQFHSLI